jgi:DNA adenine methylase
MPRQALGPVLKWAGGKSQLLPEILARLPPQIDTYFEPFVGGAAVFFALASQARFRRAVLSDKNPDLIEVYQSLKDEPKKVIARLRRYRAAHSEEAYYAARAKVPKTAAGRAARIIYLNKTGFNGLYRVNKDGQFNVPFGRYVKPNILDEPRLLAAAEVLASVEIRVADFEKSCARARAGDAVYLDPPYLPVSTTASFAEYHSEPFGIAEHERLARAFSSLGERGVVAVLSNSNTADTRRLFSDHELDIVSARRSINSDRTRRGPVGEILVTARKRESVAARLR